MKTDVCYKIIQKRVHDEAMNKFNLMLQLTRNIKKGFFKSKNELENWTIDHSFSEDERMRLNWMTLTI